MERIIKKKKKKKRRHYYTIFEINLSSLISPELK